MSTKKLASYAGLILFAWFLFVFMADDGIALLVDPDTGCEYLVSPNGALVTRIGVDYVQAGCRMGEE